MAVRRQRATTCKEIMEKDVKLAIKKAKVRFRSETKFYIFKYDQFDTTYYFAGRYPETNKETGEEVYYQKWVFTDNKWIEY
jgi:hypothetical protein